MAIVIGSQAAGNVPLRQVILMFSGIDPASNESR